MCSLTNRTPRSHPPASTAVKRTREQAVDAELMCTLVDYGVQLSKKLGPEGAAAFAPSEFTTRLCAMYVRGWDPQLQATIDRSSFDWRGFGSSVSRRFQTPRVPPFMNGVLDSEVKKRKKIVKKRAGISNGPVVSPEEVDVTFNEQQTDHAMKRMLKIVKKRRERNPDEPLHVDELVTNQKSFSQFVENIFTLSFSVKDGELGFEHRGDAADYCHPVVVKRGKPEGGNVGRSTFVLHLDLKGWRELVKSNNVKVGAIPHRDEHVEETNEMPVSFSSATERVDLGGAAEGAENLQTISVPGIGKKHQKNASNSVHCEGSPTT